MQYSNTVHNAMFHCTLFAMLCLHFQKAVIQVLHGHIPQTPGVLLPYARY